MANFADKKPGCDNTPTLGTRTLATIAETSMIDSEVRTSKRKTVWEKSSEEVEDEVEALIQSRENECPERKRRHDEFNKEWDEDEKSLDMKQTCPTPSVSPQIMASLQQVKEGFAELNELHDQIGESMDKLASASTWQVKAFFSALLMFGIID